MFETLDLIPPEEAFDGPMQMAIDDVLLVRSVRPTLRFYLWRTPCVTFGYFLRHAEVRALHPGLPLIRRRTGGGIVEHGRDLTFSVTVPRGHPAAGLKPADFYRELHRRIASWLTPFLPLPVRLAAGDDLLSGASCFAAPAGDDLMQGGCKILGGAQRRSAGALLYQGSLQGIVTERIDPCSLGRMLTTEPLMATLPETILMEATELAGKRYGSYGWTERI